MLGVVVTHVVAATLLIRDVQITDALTTKDRHTGSSHLPYV